MRIGWQGATGDDILPNESVDSVLEPVAKLNVNTGAGIGFHSHVRLSAKEVIWFDGVVAVVVPTTEPRG